MTLFCIAVWLGRITATDLRHRRIPDVLVLPGVVGVAVSAAASPVVGASAVVAALPYLIGFVGRQIGGGDVKLALVVGGLLADCWSAVLVVCVAAIMSLIAGVASAPSHGHRATAHAPAMVVATALVLAGGR